MSPITGIDEPGLVRPAGGVTSTGRLPTGTDRPPRDPLALIVPQPPRQGPATQIAGGRELWQIGSQLFLVWQVPVDSDGDGEYDDSFPIAFYAYPEQLRNAGLSSQPTRVVSEADWDRVGGLEMGSILDLNNTDQNPFQYFVDEMVRQGEVMPHLLDPEIMAVTAAAWLMGRRVEETDLMRTDWWQTHTAEERRFLTLAATDPAAVAQMLTDNRTLVLDLLEQAGINDAPTDLINLMADSFTRGEWSDNYLSNQVQVLADPAKRGTLDERVTDFLTTGSISLDTTSSRRDRVKALVHEWVGPVFGAWTDQQYDDWAGRLRNDPDAEQRLSEMLAGQRMALFPTYTDPTATYQDIASPWKAVVNQAWGQIPDETDPLFTQIVQTNDLGTVQKVLRSEGLARGNKLVGTEALRDLHQSLGGQVVRMQ